MLDLVVAPVGFFSILFSTLLYLLYVQFLWLLAVFLAIIDRVVNSSCYYSVNLLFHEIL